MFMFRAAPAMTLPRAKNAIHRSMIGLRPNVSASAPESGRIAVLDRAYAEPIHTNLSPPRSAVMVGSAVPTAVRSRALRNKETTRAMKVSQNVLPFLGFMPTSGGRGRDLSIVSNTSEDDMMVDRGCKPMLPLFNPECRCSLRCDTRFFNPPETFAETRSIMTVSYLLNSWFLIEFQSVRRFLSLRLRRVTRDLQKRKYCVCATYY
jgi:hypothetical protein